MPLTALPRVEKIEQLMHYGIPAVSVAIGTFDGMHRGHQAIFDHLKILAKNSESTPIALTFHPHPRQLLMQGEILPLLTDRARKEDLLRFYGAQGIVTVPFEPEFAALSPLEFIQHVLLETGKVQVRGVVIGTHWHFGAKAAGDTALLRRELHKHSIRTVTVDELCYNNHVVSSTAIRRAVYAGELELARTMLGRNYRICGPVVPGYGNAGRCLAVPTANIEIGNKVLPPPGVYAAWAQIEHTTRLLPAVAVIGRSPTFHYEKEETRLEVHFLNETVDLSGQRICVEPVTLLRHERKFDSPEQLKAQIVEDLAQCTAFLSAKNLNPA